MSKLHPFTDQEAEIWAMLRAVCDRMNELPDLKNSERHDAGRHIRELQALIIIRSARRNYPKAFNPNGT